MEREFSRFRQQGCERVRAKGLEFIHMHKERHALLRWAKCTNSRLSPFRGVRKAKIGSIEVEVYRYDPKPYKHVEYWECFSCNRQEQSPLRSSHRIH